MPSDTPKDPPAQIGPVSTVEYLLFDSLVHHLIEKGVLTRNDALSVVQSAAEVIRGRIHETNASAAPIEAALATLERTYSSFEALAEHPGRPMDGHNVHPLRAPLHRGRPHFPTDEN
jgi:hypothetical protein